MEIRQAGKVHGYCYFSCLFNTLDVAELGRGVIAVYVRDRDFQNEENACEVLFNRTKIGFGYIADCFAEELEKSRLSRTRRLRVVTAD